MRGQRAVRIFAHGPGGQIDAWQAEVALAELGHVAELDILHVGEGHERVGAEMFLEFLSREILVDAELGKPGQHGFVDDLDHVGFLRLRIHALDGVNVVDPGHLALAEGLGVALDHIVKEKLDRIARAVGDELDAVFIEDFPAHAGNADGHLARAADFLRIIIAARDLHPPELGDDGRDAQQEDQTDDLNTNFGFEKSHAAG